MLVPLLLSALAFAQAPLRYQNFCQKGGQTVVVQGLNSTTKVQASYPLCTVNVYLTGTLTLATIYSDAIFTPLANPFTANSDSSFGFYASSSICYDVTVSGGTPAMPSPFTYSNICLGFGGSGGTGTPGGAINQLQYNLNGTSFGGVTNLASGAQLVSKGTSTLPAFQTKAVYDVRDWMVCDGVTDATIGMAALLSAIGSTPSAILFSGQSCVLGTLVFPPNITLDFSAGGSVKGIVNNTIPGGAAFVSGSSTNLNFPTVINSCSVTLTTTGTPSSPTVIVFMGAPYPGFTYNFNSPTDTGSHVYIPVQTSLAGQPRDEAAWAAAGITTSGSVTITATSTGTLTHAQCMAHEYSGMGPGVAVDGNLSDARGTALTMDSGSATTTAGSLLIGYGGQPFTAETCTAGAGYIQPAGVAGQTTGGAMCAEYKLSSAGGSTSATQVISTPLGGGETWVYSMLALKPGSSTLFIQGSVVNPNLHQIFYNALGGLQGTIDFTGNLSDITIHPEWWGASPAATAAVNTPAIQAAVHGAFGTNRSNASGLAKWNKTLEFDGQYTINDDIQWYHVIGSAGARLQVICKNGGLTQSGVDKRHIDGQSIAYIQFRNCTWISTNNSTKPQIDLDYDGVITAGDLRPQFIDFYNNSFIGNGLADVGVLIAKSGGGAQGSNIYCYDCAAQSFTGAAWQMGGNNTGRNVGRFYALNALALGWYGGDIQGSPLYGIAAYGAGYIFAYGTTFENGFSAQTGFDMYVEAGQGPCIMDGVRSESRRLASCNQLDIKDSGTGNGQMQYPTPGTSTPVGTIIGGDITGIGWDGRYYKVTINTNGFNGAGTPSVPIIASSGTATTIANTNQNVAGATTIGTFVAAETVTQAVTGSTATLRNLPVSIGTITGSVSSGTIGASHTMTQAVTGVTCTSQNAPTGTQSLTCLGFSGTANNSNIWTDGTTAGTYTPTAAPTFAPTTMVISAASNGPDNSHNWTGGTSGAVFVPTAVPVNQVNWGVNAFNGMLMAVLGGTTNGCYGVVTSNTATSITFSAGLVTRFYHLTCPNPDNTSTFVVEPNWNNGTVVDDNVPGCTPCMTMVSLNEDGIGGGLAGQNALGVLDNVSVPGDMIKIDPRNTTLRNVLTTRADWLDSAAGYPQQPQVSHNWDVSVTPSLSRVSRYYQNWSLPFNGGGQRTYVGPFHTDLGTSAFVWSCSGATVPACNDVFIGGRSNPNALVDATQNVLEFGGMLGRAVPFGTDLAGTDTDITGGPSTGTGAGGAINFYTSVPGASSATVNTGSKRARINAAGQIESLLATGTAPLIVASTTQVTNLNASQLIGGTWAIPGTIGATTPNTGAFTSISATGQITSTLATGTAPLVIASTTNVPNLNASSLNGATFAAPGAIGGGTPGSGAFTTISATGQITSTLATGTAPIVIASTTTVPNLTLSNHPKVQACGATSACSAIATLTGQVVFGSAPLVSGTPSTVTITGISPAFTSSSSYVCIVSEATTAANNLLKVANVSGSSFTITGPNTLTDIINYVCAGN